MEWSDILTALANLWTVVGQCVNFFVDNPALMVMFVTTLAGVGFRTFRKAKRAAR